MFRFYADRFWDADEAQNIQASLVQWSQDCEESSDFLAQLFMFVACGCIGAFVLAKIGGPDAEVFVQAAVGLFALGVAIVLFGHHLCTDHCELTFHRDGTITMPGGFFGNLVFGPYVLGDFREIAAVQSQEADTLKPDPNKPKRYEVWLYFHNGASFPIAASLFKPQAHQVAVLLEQALEDIRKAGAQECGDGRQAWAEVIVE